MVRIKFVSLWISLSCVIFFILQLLIPHFTENLMLTTQALVKPWQFLTAIFLHANIGHLFYNLFALVFFGLMLESIIGSKKLFSLYLFSGIVANLIAFSFYPNSLGASGAIMALIGCLALLKPLMTVWAFGMIMPMFILAIIWAVGSILGIFGLGDPSAGHLAHLSGLVIGILYGIFLRFNKNGFEEKVLKEESEEPLISEDYVRIWEDNHFK